MHQALHPSVPIKKFYRGLADRVVRPWSPQLYLFKKSRTFARLQLRLTACVYKSKSDSTEVRLPTSTFKTAVAEEPPSVSSFEDTLKFIARIVGKSLFGTLPVASGGWTPGLF